MAGQIFRFSGQHCDYQGDASSKEAKALLGGKGAGLVMMAQQGLNVPPGFTIPTTHCKAFMALSPALREEFIDKPDARRPGSHDLVGEPVRFHAAGLGALGRSGLVCPGMMDTILNVGLTTDVYHDWEQRIGVRGAADCERRLVQMLGSTGYGVPMEVFDFQLAKIKKEVGETSDTGLTSYALSKAALEMRKAFEKNKGFEFPINDAHQQLRTAIKAVFESWMNPRAIEYRKINKIDEGMGTAVTVQAMVFGNMGDDSGTGRAVLA